MTRIEQENKPNQQFDELESEINTLKKQLKRKQSRKFFNCRSCALLIIIIFIVMGSFMAALAAKTGLWQIPFFTAYFYHQPVPIYEIKAADFDEGDLVAQLGQSAKMQAIKQQKSSDLNISIELGEEKVTALLLAQIKKDESLAGKVETLQLAFTGDTAQLFIKLRSPQDMILTLDFRPEVKDNLLRVKVLKIKLGDLNLPKFLGSMLADNIIDNTINQQLNSYGQIAEIESIELAEHKISINLIINNLNF